MVFCLIRSQLFLFFLSSKTKGDFLKVPSVSLWFQSGGVKCVEKQLGRFTIHSFSSVSTQSSQVQTSEGENRQPLTTKTETEDSRDIKPN